MSLSEYCKSEGFKNVVEFGKASNTATSTLQGWYKVNKPKIEELMLLSKLMMLAKKR